jgi:hypothetical protein
MVLDKAQSDPLWKQLLVGGPEAAMQELSEEGAEVMGHGMTFRNVATQGSHYYNVWYPGDPTSLPIPTEASLASLSDAGSRHITGSDTCRSEPAQVNNVFLVENQESGLTASTLFTPLFTELPQMGVLGNARAIGEPRPHRGIISLH